MTRDVLAISDLADEEIEEIFRRAEQMEAVLAGREKLHDAAGSIMATLFYEPRTRTRLSFEAAMWRLRGAGVTGPPMQSSAAGQGQSRAGTVKVGSPHTHPL